MRIQLEVTEKNAQELVELKEKINISTWKELFSNALTLLDWAIKQTEQGRLVGSIDEKNMTYRELVMPCLQVVAKTNGDEQSKKEN